MATRHGGTGWRRNGTELEVRCDEPAHSIHNEVRAFLPWPTVVVGFRGTLDDHERFTALDEGGEP